MGIDLFIIGFKLYKYFINFIFLVMKKNGEGGIKYNIEGKERKKRLNWF